MALYGVDKMRQWERAKFEAWYREATESAEPFNMVEQLEKHCISDVDVLRSAVLKFRAVSLAMTNIDPFSECVTKACFYSLTLSKTSLRNR